ncbi:MAG: acetyl-CoA acetyltransferase [Dehalococcoidia bacterium]
MNPSAIRDKVAIIGMGCTKFGENWDMSAEDMMIEAAYEAYEDAGVGPEDIEAAWVGTVASGITGNLLAAPLKFRFMPITRIENACGTGQDTLRNATLGVACGLYDMVLVMGVEKLKDSGLSGLPEFFTHPVYGQGATAPGRWALGATRYFSSVGLSPEEGKRCLAKIAMKNHHNGTMSPKAHFQREITMEQALNAPVIAWPLGLFDCCPTTDGAAAAIITSTETAKKLRPAKDYVLVRGFGVAMGSGWGKENFDYKYDYLPETIAAGKQAYEQAGITDPRRELSMAQIHDCFTIAEMMEYEALGFSPAGKASEDIDAGTFELTGELPVNTDGGLKSFGHPVGATGIRMCYEIYKQIQGKAQLPARQLKDPKMGLAMAQGGHPGFLQPVVAILGRSDLAK